MLFASFLPIFRDQFQDFWFLCVCVCVCVCIHVFFGFLKTECVVKLSRKKASGSHSLQSAANSLRQSAASFLKSAGRVGWGSDAVALPYLLDCVSSVCACARACVCVSICLLEAHGHWGGVIGPCSFPCSILQVSCKFPTCMHLPS